MSDWRIRFAEFSRASASMENWPQVSVVIPVFNGSNFLSEAIDSALAQDYPNFEVIVINDGSTDDGATERVALAYGSAIRYFSKPNGGVASALNYAIHNMKGEYFSWLSHDDLYMRSKISRQVDAALRHGSGDVIVYSLAGAFLDDQNVFRQLDIPHECSNWFKYFLATNSSLHGCTLLIPRAAFQVCGRFDERLQTTQDYDMWFRLAEKYRFLCVREVLVKARQHGAQGTVTMSSVVRRECDSLVCSFVSRMKPADMAAYKEGARTAWLELARISYRRGLVKSARLALSKIDNVSLEAILVRLAGELTTAARFALITLRLR